MLDIIILADEVFYNILVEEEGTESKFIIF
jgi:hypothetical protein